MLALAVVLMASVILGLEAGLAFAPPPARPLPPPPVSRDGHEASLLASAERVWQVWADGKCIGSAVPVAEEGDATVFLTAKHLHPHNPDHIIMDGRARRIVHFEPHPWRDIALAWTEGVPDSPRVDLVPLAEREPRVFEKVAAVGWAASKYRTLTEGRACLPADWGLNSIATTPTIFGNSGGALLTRDGKLLGITVALSVVNGEVVPHLTHYVPLSDVSGWLRWYGVGFEN